MNIEEIVNLVGSDNILKIMKDMSKCKCCGRFH